MRVLVVGTVTLDTLETLSKWIEMFLYISEYVDTTTIFLGSEKEPDQHCKTPHQFFQGSENL